MGYFRVCPLCGSDNCAVTHNEGDGFDYLVICSTYKCKFILSRSFVEDYYQSQEFTKAMDLIAEKLIRNQRARNGKLWRFFYSRELETIPNNNESINLAPILLNYPQTFMERADRALLNISIRNPEYGNAIHMNSTEYRLIFSASEDISGMILILEDLGYLKHLQHSWLISAEGWKHIEELKKKHAETKQGFIAMSFRPETVNIRKCFKAAIITAGFNPMIIDEKEHNHQIVPELLMEIQKSKFLVLDVTYPNYGAYYEAGYALALGKEVIICCDNEVFSSDEYERPHFDIAQASQIRWNTEEELVERLTKRIKATVTE